MNKIKIKDANTLITYLNSFQGWGIKSYDSFIVTWQEDDDLLNWCQEDKCGISRQCFKKTEGAIKVLKILGWDKDTVCFES